MSAATASNNTPTPFTVAVDAKEIAELNRRLDTARWPLADVVPIAEGQEEVGAFGMGYGTSPESGAGCSEPQLTRCSRSYAPFDEADCKGMARGLLVVQDAGLYQHVSCSSVRACTEADLYSSFKHFKVSIEDLSIHFIHHKSPSPTAIPLILAHGWPGSFLEFLPIIDSLTNPPEGSQAFHVVVPSMPGFAFSSPPPSHKWVMVSLFVRCHHRN